MSFLMTHIAWHYLLDLLNKAIVKRYYIFDFWHTYTKYTLSFYSKLFEKNIIEINFYRKVWLVNGARAQCKI